MKKEEGDLRLQLECSETPDDRRRYLHNRSYVKELRHEATTKDVTAAAVLLMLLLSLLMLPLLSPIVVACVYSDNATHGPCVHIVTIYPHFCVSVCKYAE